MAGELVFVTGISGSGVDEHITKVVDEAEKHGHKVKPYDIGEIMHKYAKQVEPDIVWERILDADERALQYLRLLALQELAHELAYNIRTDPDMVHIADLHLSFRWRGYLLRGMEPYLIERFRPHIRCFFNIIEDLAKIQERLEKTSWGRRGATQLLIWRDEELILTDFLADISGRVPSYAIIAAEPPELMERLIWHPEIRRVYLSFPITHFVETGDMAALEEIQHFRDRIREFLVAFDPYASKDYDQALKKPEMKEIISEIGDVTEAKDYRLIDQSQALVVYFPRKVPSKGVDSEMRHARRKGKRIFLYCPEELGGGPFAVSPDYYSADVDEFVAFLKENLAPRQLTNQNKGGQ